MGNSLRRRLLVGALGSAAMAKFPVGVAAPVSYPDRPVRLLVPVSVGGGTDIIARLVADQLGRAMSQTWIVENQGGASGQIATQATARAAADGYNLMIGYVSTHGTLPALRKLPYDPIRDFSHIAMIGGAPSVLVTSHRGPVTFEEFLADCRAHPGKANYASAGNGTITHLEFEGLMLATGLELTHIPYRGLGPAFTDLLAGQVQYAMPGLAGVLPHIRSGAIRAIAVSGPQRAALLPDVPTLKELGVPHFEDVQWVGVMGPANIPPAIVRTLSGAINGALGDGGLAEKLSAEGIAVMPMSPQAFNEYVSADLARWQKIVHERGLKES